MILVCFKMPLRQDEILSVCQQLAEEENLKVCVTESLKGACIAGGCALVGSLLMGPPGLAIGNLLYSYIDLIKVHYDILTNYANFHFFYTSAYVQCIIMNMNISLLNYKRFFFLKYYLGPFDNAN